MTSKEALSKLKNNFGLSFIGRCLCEIIEKDLNRLEKINNVWHENEPMESVDINGNHLQEVYDFLHITIKELEKYKKGY